MQLKNIFDLSKVNSLEKEYFEQLINEKSFYVERIVSKGHVTPKGEWYDQGRDEWVMLLQGEAEILYDDLSGDKMYAGDCLLIPAHKRHRVIYTSEEPECIWLAIHFEKS